MKINKLYPPKHNSFVFDDLPIHASTLFGALANYYVNLYGSDSFKDFISLFDKGKISSILPALKVNENEIFFLPKPFLSKQKSEEGDKEFIFKKKIKKIRWLSVDATEKLGNSIKKIGNDYLHSVDFINDFTMIGNKFLITKNELDPKIAEKIAPIPLYKKTNSVKVNVSRFGADSNPFDQSEISFTDSQLKVNNEDFAINVKLFLYFLEDMEADNEKWNATKSLFADEGIGGKRNLGKGYFEKIETTEFQFENPDNPKLYLLTSNIIPQKNELENILNYETGIDDGFITYGYASTMKKDPLFFLKEGTVISSLIEGKITSQNFFDKTIYRYGKALLLPLGGKNE